MSLVPTPPASDLEAVQPQVRTLAAAFLLGYEGATREAYRRDLRAGLPGAAAHDIDPVAAERAHVDA